MRTARRKLPILVRISLIFGFLLALFSTEVGTVRDAAAQSQQTPQTPLPPLYRITGYERREESLTRREDLRALLGPAGYRQYVASRTLLIIGGVAAFAGSMALLSTLGSMAQTSNFGADGVGIYAKNYKSYVYGFSGLLAAGGGILITGLILSLPLPPRKRTLLVPHLQIVETPRF